MFGLPKVHSTVRFSAIGIAQVKLALQLALHRAGEVETDFDGLWPSLSDRFWTDFDQSDFRFGQTNFGQTDFGQC